MLDLFYNADIAIIDLSIQVQQSTLFYHLGVRESFGMRQNILLYNDHSRDTTSTLKTSCNNYCFVSYKLINDNQIHVTESTSLLEGSRVSLTTKLKHHLQDMEVQSK